MNPTDLDKMVDKLLQFHKRIPNIDRYPELTWWQRECIKELRFKIHELISTIDVVGDAFQ